jgi:hypothetical protein
MMNGKVRGIEIIILDFADSHEMVRDSLVTIKLLNGNELALKIFQC